MSQIHFVKRTLALAIASVCLTAQAMPVEATSPYAAVPLNLQGAEFIPPNVMLLLDISGSMCYYADNRTGTDCAYLNSTTRTNDLNRKISIAAQVSSDLFRNNPNVRWGFSVFSSSGVPSGTVNNVAVPVGNYSSTHLQTLLDRVDYYWQNAGGQTYMYQAYDRMLNYYADQYRGSSGYASPVQYRCQKNNLILVGDGQPTDSAPTTSGVLGTINPRTFAQMSKLAYTGDLGLSGNDMDGKPFHSVEFPRQYMSTYTVGFSVDLAIFKDAAAAGGGKYFTANDAAGLNRALQTSLNDIMSKNSSTAAPVSTSQPTSGLIQVGFNTKDWSGSLKSFPVSSAGAISSTAVEATVPTVSNRMVFTSYGTGVRAFTKIDPANSAMLADTTTFGSHPEWTLRFLKGEEPTNDTTWRKRNGKLLGDFINTEPETLNGGNDFVAGGNDGLLHYFRRANSSVAFSELFAYAPSATLGKVQHVAQQDYGQDANPHRYLVDGALVTQKLFDAVGANRTVMVGSLGRGGKGLYALDLDKITATSTSATIPTTVGLWDLNSEDSGVWNGGANMGYTLGRPVIAKVKQPATATGDEPWMVISGNGYDSTSVHPSSTGQSAVFFFDAKTGTRMGNVLISGSGSAKPGIGGVAVMDTNGDNVADIVYAGDRNGDLWRIDLRAELHPNSGTPASEATRVYKIWSGSPDQPITMAPTLHRINNNEVMVLFGTGSMLADADKSDKKRQSIYGIRDDISVAPVTYSYATDRGSSGRLLEQTIEDTLVGSSESYRKVSQNPLPEGGSKRGGWYMDLSVGTNSAERITQPMMVLAGGVFFTTQIPSTPQTDHCTSGGDGWVMALSATTGAAPLKPVIASGLADFATGTSTVAGYKTNNMGMPSALGLVSSNANTTWVTYRDLAGMINNRFSYGEEGLISGLQLVVSSENIGGGNGGITPVKISAKNNVTQGYRTSWREIS